MVFVNATKGDFSKLPGSVQTALNHKDLGRIIPKVVVMDKDLSSDIAKVKYEDWKDESKTLRRVKEAIKEHKEEASNKNPSRSNVDIKADTKETGQTTGSRGSGKLLVWTNTQGKKVTAWFVKYNEDSVTLKTVSGKKVDYPLDKLSEESRSLAQSLHAESGGQ